MPAVTQRAFPPLYKQKKTYECSGEKQIVLQQEGRVRFLKTLQAFALLRSRSHQSASERACPVS